MDLDQSKIAVVSALARETCLLQWNHSNFHVFCMPSMTIYLTHLRYLGSCEGDAVADDFRLVDVPFPTARLASIALRSLQVDKELSSLVRRTLSFAPPTTGADGEDPVDRILRVEYRATTNRMLRVAVNSFMESLNLVLEVMEQLDTDVLVTEAPLE